MDKGKEGKGKMDLQAEERKIRGGSSHRARGKEGNSR